MFIITAVKKLRQEDCHKFEVNIDLVSEGEKKEKEKSFQPRICHLKEPYSRFL